MKCTKDNCPKEAEFVIDGQSVCQEHKDNKASGSAGDIMAGKLEL